MIASQANEKLYCCLRCALKTQESQVKIQDGIVIGKVGDRLLEADLFLPPIDAKERPAILFVHGGGWREGDRTQLRGYAILLARLGFVTLSTSYRLSTEAVWPAQIQDINCASVKNVEPLW